jgi:hypothetical protein
MTWLKVRTESVLDQRWQAIASATGLRAGDVGFAVMALLAEAARVKTETGTATIKDFDWFVLAAFLGEKKDALTPIVGELVRRGLIGGDGTVVTGVDWDAHLTARARVQLKQRLMGSPAVKRRRRVPHGLGEPLGEPAEGAAALPSQGVNWAPPPSDLGKGRYPWTDENLRAAGLDPDDPVIKAVRAGPVVAPAAHTGMGVTMTLGGTDLSDLEETIRRIAESMPEPSPAPKVMPASAPQWPPSEPVRGSRTAAEPVAHPMNGLGRCICEGGIRQESCPVHGLSSTIRPSSPAQSTEKPPIIAQFGTSKVPIPVAKPLTAEIGNLTSPPTRAPKVTAAEVDALIAEGQIDRPQGAIRGDAPPPPEVSRSAVERPHREQLLQALVGAANGNVRRDKDTGMFVPAIADVTPITKLIAGGASLELDILPAITATVAVEGQPSIPRWDLDWIIDEIRRNTVARGMPDPCPTAPRPRNRLNLSSSPTRAPV